MRSHGAAALLCLLTAACSVMSTAPPALPGAVSSVEPSPLHRIPRPSVTTTTVPPLPGWKPLSRTASGTTIEGRVVTTSDGARVTLICFRAGQVRFDLHVGSQDPPSGGVGLPATSQPAVAPSERPLLLGAFNGGFKTAAGAGGVEIDGHVLAPLLAGVASLVIDADGSARIGIWGQSVPVPGEPVMSVRQNLPPLVLDARPSPSVGSVGAWGSTLHGVAFQARSALGVRIPPAMSSMPPAWAPSRGTWLLPCLSPDLRSLWNWTSTPNGFRLTSHRRRELPSWQSSRARPSHLTRIYMDGPAISSQSMRGPETCDRRPELDALAVQGGSPLGFGRRKRDRQD